MAQIPTVEQYVNFVGPMQAGFTMALAARRQRAQEADDALRRQSEQMLNQVRQRQAENEAARLAIATQEAETQKREQEYEQNWNAKLGSNLRLLMGNSPTGQEPAPGVVTDEQRNSWLSEALMKTTSEVGPMPPKLYDSFKMFSDREQQIRERQESLEQMRQMGRERLLGERLESLEKGRSEDAALRRELAEKSASQAKEIQAMRDASAAGRQERGIDQKEISNREKAELSAIEKDLDSVNSQIEKLQKLVSVAPNVGTASEDLKSLKAEQTRLRSRRNEIINRNSAPQQSSVVRWVRGPDGKLVRQQD